MKILPRIDFFLSKTLQQAWLVMRSNDACHRSKTWETLLATHIELIFDFEPLVVGQMLICTSHKLRKLVQSCPICADKNTCRSLGALQEGSFLQQTQGCGCSSLQGMTEHQQKQAVLLIMCVPPKQRTHAMLWVLRWTKEHGRLGESLSPKAALQALWVQQPLQQADFELFFGLLCCTAQGVGELLQYRYTVALSTGNSKLNDDYMLKLCRVFSERPAHSDLGGFCIYVSQGQLTERAFQNPSLWICIDSSNTANAKTE